MSTPSSNMISKHYCPECGGFELVKLHRSFIQKRIFKAPNKLFCQNCELVLSFDDFSNNLAKEVPVFLTGSATKAPAEMINEVSESLIEEQIAPMQSSSESVREDVTEDIHLPVTPKKKGVLKWFLYVAGALVISGGAYLGYKYTSSNAGVSEEPARSVNVPQTPSLNVVETEKEESIVVPQVQTFVIEERTERSQARDPVSDLENAELSQFKASPVAIVEEVVEKSQELVTVAKLDAEVRIVLPYKDSGSSLKNTVLTVDTQQVTKKELEKSDPLIEKAAIEFMKSDLDKLLGN